MPQDFDPAFDALQEQDWISSRLVSTGQDADGQEAAGRRVLDVESSIRDHMRVYFERRGQILPAARRRAASFLQQRTLEDPLESLEWTDYDAALRASDADLEQAVAWWQRLETRLFDAYLAEKQNPEALHTLLQTLSGRDGACGMRDPQAGAEIPPENRLRPYVLAALAAVQQFMPEPARRRDTWRQVEEIVMRQAGADGPSRWTPEPTACCAWPWPVRLPPRTTRAAIWMPGWSTASSARSSARICTTPRNSPLRPPHSRP